MMHRMRKFIQTAEEIVGSATSEQELLNRIHDPFAELIAVDDWLPDEFAAADPVHYQQYLLYVDPQERFSILSLVWGPGQKTPIHNHTVWGLVGMLRGAELSTRYDPPVEGQPMRALQQDRLEPGMIDVVSPTVGDIHLVENAFDDRVSISIHVYGGNIGKTPRAVYDPETGIAKQFISGFSGEASADFFR